MQIRQTLGQDIDFAIIGEQLLPPGIGLLAALVVSLAAWAGLIAAGMAVLSLF